MERDEESWLRYTVYKRMQSGVSFFFFFFFSFWTDKHCDGVHWSLYSGSWEEMMPPVTFWIYTTPCSLFFLCRNLSGEIVCLSM